jgi:acetoin utilization protein AcuB
MPKTIPKISKYMTTTPHSINATESMFQAMAIMEDNDIRHLPVMRESKVIGILSDRDLKTMLSLGGSFMNPNTIMAGDICSDLPYTTTPEALLNEVVREMAEKKLGSAVVVDNGKLVGIFTAVDACLALSDICEKRFHY